MRLFLATYLIVSIFAVSLSSVNYSIHSFFCDLEVAEETDYESHGCESDHAGDCASSSPEDGDGQSTECSSTTCPVIAFSSATIYLDTAFVHTQVLVSFEFTGVNTPRLASEKLGKYNLVRGPPLGSTV